MISYQLRLDAEATNGGGDWVTGAGNGIIRQTGQSGNYELLYSLNSTTYGVFNDVVLTVTLYDVYDNINSFFGVGLSAGATYTTDVTTNEKILRINLGSDIQAGQSGIIGFSVLSNANRGPNGYQIESSTVLSGTFLDATTQVEEVFSTRYEGPYWQVAAENPHNYTKTVRYNGNFYTSEEEAYVIEYALTDSVTDDEGGEGIGSWGYISAQTIDTLPTPGGVNPVVLYSNVTPYTVDGNRVIWDMKPPNNVYHVFGNALYLRVQYPKSAIDAIGGIAALGNITNTVDVNFVLIGDVAETKSTSVTHVINPIPTAVPGTINTQKYAPNYREEPYPANGLFVGNGDIAYTILSGLSNSNIITTEHIVTDFGFTYQLANGERQTLTDQEFVWKNIRIVTFGVTGVLEFTTNINPTFQPGPTIAQNAVDFPTLPTGEYITQFRLRMTGNPYPVRNIHVYLIVTLKQRSEALPLIESIENTIHNQVTLSTGQMFESDYTAVLPVDYVSDIYWELPATTVSVPLVSLNGTFDIYSRMIIKSETSITVRGTHYYILIPDDFILEPRNAAETAIPNWRNTGMTLVHYQVSQDTQPLQARYFARRLYFRARATARLGDHTIYAFYVVNPEQASDPDITLHPVGQTAPDIFDLDQNGDTAQLVPSRTVKITVSPVNVVNVVKMSKAFTDSDYVINNDTQITGGERFNYKLFVRNDSTSDLGYLTMIDVFPYAGDRFGSAWSPLLASVPVVPAHVTVSYSTSVTPDMRPIEDTGDGAWTTSPPDDLTTVRALKFDFGDNIYAPGDFTEIFLDMQAPFGETDLASAFNSVSYIASAISGDTVTQYLPAYSPPAYARLTYRVFDTFVGDFVWSDVNNNGLQDEDEPGLNGINVQLLDTNGTIVYETQTANHPTTGQAGYYAFENIWPASYYASFPTQLEDGSTLTTERQGNGVLPDSAPDMMTGLSMLFDVVEGVYRTDIDAGYIMMPEEVGNTIGDFVWNDANGNGIQDVGESGINGVPVYLIYNTSTYQIAQETTRNHPVTGQPGYYEFTGVPAGRYEVQFPVSLPDGSTLTIQNAGVYDDLNSKPDPLTGFTAPFVVTAGETVLNMDAGYILVPPTEYGVIGDFVWNDANGNGIQDVGEVGINGVQVTLLDESGTQQIAQQLTRNHPSTGAPGFYAFMDLPLGNYRVQFPTTLADGSVLTIPNAGTDDNINSKPAMATGLTPVIAVTSALPILNVDAGYMQEAVVPEGEVLFSKTADRRTVKPCECITYTLRVENQTRNPITSLVLDEYVLTGVVKVCSITVLLNGVETQAYTHTIRAEDCYRNHTIALAQALAPGDAATVMLVVQVEECACPQVLQNTAYAEWTTGSAEASAIVTLLPNC